MEGLSTETGAPWGPSEGTSQPPGEDSRETDPRITGEASFVGPPGGPPRGPLGEPLVPGRAVGALGPPVGCRKVCVLASSEVHFCSTSQKGEKEFVAEAGVSLASLLAMHRACRSCGYTLEFVTPSGSPPPVASFGSLEEVGLLLSKQREADAEMLLQQLQQTQQLRKATAADYCCLLLPHHLGAAIDLYNSTNTGALIKEFGALKKPVGVLGYGAFALCAKPLSGSEGFPLAGRLISTVPLAEEARHPYFGLLPLHLELHFAAEGARTAAAPGGSEGLVIDGQLVSASSETATELLLRVLILLASMQQQQQHQ
ncbi:uncharacterized protein EMH_0006460 [Eimeria mitis]|uniref:Uncharacterized protein n=1 Tax=Eimeria mitis TaxID=44415 RepID=U6KKQ1_9EIME|nr:uncharacterized protein EMH_0006460 [Eimeria mitis]CDJ36038.1 hypothetical protein, conserved [Eimeria mitis]